MLPARQPSLQAFDSRLRFVRSGAAMALALGVAWPGMAAAQGTPDPLAPGPSVASEATSPTPEFNAAGERQVNFEANTLTYDQYADVVTAAGDVILRSGDQSVRADEVSWDRKSGLIVATGNVRLVDADGNQLLTDRAELTDELKVGAMSNLLLALREGGRLAAEQAERLASGEIILTHANYSGCAVETPEGCPTKPSWRVTADRVIYNPESRSVQFKGAYLELFGVRALPLLGLNLRTDGGASSGFMVPNLGYSRSNGFELSQSYYMRLAHNRDLELSGYVFSLTAPMISASYRQLVDDGAFQVTGYLTQGSRIPLISTGPSTKNEVRGFFTSNGRFQLGDDWTATYSARLASDRTFLRRFDISRDDRLRSTFNFERITDSSYLSFAGWATQVLLTDQSQGMVPVALPVIDYRKRLADPVFGGKVELQFNTLALTRPSGQDTQRAFARAQWDLRRVTAWGQELTFTGLLRTDAYHTSDTLTTITAQYRGLPGWQVRGVAVGAVDLKWPFAGNLFRGTQVLTPRVQLFASPTIRNLAIPNEDARAIELEDSNLFALNRFPGYDRVEDGVRLTYGFDWLLEQPGWRLHTTVGQSYRMTDKPALFPDGTGLSEKFSDWVGRTELRLSDFVRFTHRFRLDKDNLGIRRNEVDATVGTNRNYLELGYLRLNRDIDLTFEDLQDREELRAAGRVTFARYWSVFGSAVVNLTDRNEDPSFTSDGFKPLRTRLGIAYSDDCLEFGLTWRRDYVAIADARQGNSFQVFFSLKGIGLR